MKSYAVFLTDIDYNYMLIDNINAGSLLDALKIFQSSEYYLNLNVKEEVIPYIEEGKLFLVWGKMNENYYTIEEN